MSRPETTGFLYAVSLQAEGIFMHKNMDYLFCIYICFVEHL